MKYKVTLKGKVYEVIVEKGEAILADEYDYVAPAAPAAVPVPVAPAMRPWRFAIPGFKHISSPVLLFAISIF